MRILSEELRVLIQLFLKNILTQDFLLRLLTEGMTMILFQRLSLSILARQRLTNLVVGTSHE